MTRSSVDSLQQDATPPPSGASANAPCIHWLLLASFSLSAVLGALAYNAISQRAPALRGVSTEPTVIDLGTLWAQSDFRVTVPVVNDSPDSLEIVDFSASCTCTSVEPPSMTIPGYGTSEFRATLDLVPYRPQEYQSETRPVDLMVAATTSEKPPCELTWKLHATVKNAIGVNPIITIDPPVILGAEPLRHTVLLAAYVPLKKIDATCDANVAEVSVTSDPKDESRFNLHIQPQSRSGAGPFSFPVTLKPTDGGGTPIPEIKLNVRCHAVEDLQASPPAIAGGMLRQGEQFRQEIALTSRQGHAFRIKDVFGSTDSLSIQVVAADASGIQKVIVTAEGTGAGQIHGDVTVVAEDLENGRIMSIMIPVAGYVLPKSNNENLVSEPEND